MKTLTLADGRTVEVRRMTWRAMRFFLRQLAKDVAEFPRNDGRIVLFENLPAVIAKSDVLAQMIITGSTGIGAEELDQLDALSASELLRLGVEVNFDQEFAAAVAGITEQIVGIMNFRLKAAS